MSLPSSTSTRLQEDPPPTRFRIRRLPYLFARLELRKLQLALSPTLPGSLTIYHKLKLKPSAFHSFSQTEVSTYVCFAGHAYIFHLAWLKTQSQPYAQRRQLDTTHHVIAPRTNNPLDLSFILNPTDSSLPYVESQDKPINDDSTSLLSPPKPNPTLPLEILIKIFRHYLYRPPVCALSLLCPEEDICSHSPPKELHRRKINSPFKRLRVDVYKRPADSSLDESRSGSEGPEA